MPATVPFGIGCASGGAVVGNTLGRFVGKFFRAPTVCDRCGAELINTDSVPDHGSE
jgi:hypothetical protein